MANLIVNPSREQLVEAIETAIETANYGARTRTIQPNADTIADEVFSTSAGRDEVDGGGVANKYGYVAYSSAFAIAWATDCHGLKHVRIDGQRVRCSGRHVKSLNLGTRKQQEKLFSLDLDAMLVYEELFSLYSGFAIEPEWKESIRKGIDNKKEIDLSPMMAYADWLDEKGESKLSNLIHSFFGVTANAN